MTSYYSIYIPLSFPRLEPNLRWERRGLAVFLLIDWRAPSSNKTVSYFHVALTEQDGLTDDGGQFIFSATWRELIPRARDFFNKEIRAKSSNRIIKIISKSDQPHVVLEEWHFAKYTCLRNALRNRRLAAQSSGKSGMKVRASKNSPMSLEKEKEKWC